MDNDKKELIYVMNLLKKQPHNEISKDYSNFKINKKFYFNMKPETKFEPMVINDNFFNNLVTPSTAQNETVFITLQANKFKENGDINNDNISTKNTLTKQYSAKDITNNANYNNYNKYNSTNKAGTFFQKSKPNLNITKFSNATRTASLLREHKWFNRGNNFNDYNSSFFKKNTRSTKPIKNQKRDNIFMNRLISKIKIRYLNFRPYIDLPNIITTNNKLEENNKNIDMDNSDTLSIITFNNQSQTIQQPKNYYFKLIGNECLLVKKLLEDNGFIQSRSNEPWTIGWSSGHIKLNSYEKLNKYQKVNHFPRSNELTRKDLLYKNLSKLKEQFPGAKFDFLPESYILPNEYTFLKDKMDKNPNQFWIVKPVASSQGRGIFLTKNISEIPNNHQTIASRYITNPFLINKKKFDLRIYAFVTSIIPLRIYRFKEGLTRFSANKYNLDVNDRCAHLTNYAVNKNNKNYIQNESPFEVDYNSSKWTLTSLKQYLEENGINSELIFSKIDDIIIKTFISCENNLINAISKYCTYQENCFELYGFDILIDENLNCWLMEVNLSPNLHFDAAIDLKIKGEMVAEIFDLIRIVPYDIRNDIYESNGKYGSISKYLNYKEFKDIKITNEIKQEIWDTEEEFARVKQFKRIFPSLNYPLYQKFFDSERCINYILYIIEAYKNGILK
jgi:tubulin polyglutamylase TTLL5